MKEPTPGEPVPQGFFASLDISEPKRIGMFFGCLAAALAVALLPGEGQLEPAATRALFVLVFASLLWVTEAIPPFAVGILVIGLQVVLLGEPGGVYAKTARDWEQFISVIGHPLIWLFFGGFVLAAGMARTGIDRLLALAVLKRVGDGPNALLWGAMTLCFVLSMFVSNTATTAMMLAMLAPVLASLPEDEPFGKGLLLGLTLAANVGGMASLIGTPPNAIAVGVVADLEGGGQISFLEWMLAGLPPGLTLLILGGFGISRFYRARVERVELSSLEEGGAEGGATPRWQKGVVGGGALLTVGLWFTSHLHGIPTAAVSLIPIVLFTSTGLLRAPDLRNLSWDVLFLIAGGLALGQMVTATGLSAWLVGLLPLEGLPVAGLALLMAYATVVLANFMSHTAAANILVPIGATMAAGAEVHVAVPIALASSCAMCLPISTPPNALVYAAGRVETRDLIRLGLVMGVLGGALSVLWTEIAIEVVVALTD